MAMVFDGRMSRRDFVRGSLAAWGTAVVAGRCGGAEAGGEEPAMRWAMLSDVHIPADTANNYRGFYPHQNLEEIVPRVIASAPDAVAITGDLARLTGEVGDYANLKKLLTPLSEQAPVYLALGNHDHRENFLAAFGKGPGERQAVANKWVVVSDAPPVRVVMMDSLFVSNNAAGLLGKAQRTWLVDYLKREDEIPTLLCFHHTLADGDGDLLDLPRLYDIIAPVKKVKGLIYGHSHEYSCRQYEGIHQINLPATAYNFRESDPVGWVEARLTATGGEFTLHATAGNRDKDGAVTRLVWRT